MGAPEGQDRTQPWDLESPPGRGRGPVRPGRRWRRVAVVVAIALVALVVGIAVGGAVAERPDDDPGSSVTIERDVTRVTVQGGTSASLAGESSTSGG